MKNFTLAIGGCLFIFSALMTSSCSYQETKATDSAFSSEVESIVSNRCYQCHAGGNSNGGLSFIDDPDSLISAGYISPGNAAGSTLYKKLTSSPPFGARMPKNGPYLSDTELAEVADWINNMGTDGGGDLGPTMSFENDIKPILSTALAGNARACIGCHKGATPSGGYAMGPDVNTVTYAGVMSQNIVAGSPSTSLLYQKISMATPPVGVRMPRNGPNYLSDDDIQKVYYWILQGALDN